MEFKKLKDAIYYVEHKVRFKPKADLLRMNLAFRLLGSPSNFKKIHITGTNGKGSTASFISHILIEANQKVGTFTSPYLMDFNERFRINMEVISDQELLYLLNKVIELDQVLIREYEESLSFFEIVTLVALLYFEEQKVDYAVMEVGIGGLLDATNILNYDLSLITNIGFDHQKQLGYTKEEIAKNKLGILKKGNHLITTVDRSLFAYFTDYAQKIACEIEIIDSSDLFLISENPLVFEYQNERYSSSLIGEYQMKNAALAIKGARYLLQDLTASKIALGIEKTKWAGRFELVKKNPVIYLDGAHNIDGITELVKSSKRLFRNVVVIFSALNDKNPSGMLKILKELTSSIILTTFNDSRIMDIGPLLLEDHNLIYISNFDTALKEAKVLLNNNGVIIITGSLHFIGNIRRKFKIVK